MESDKGDLSNKPEQSADKASSISCTAFSDASSVASMDDVCPQIEDGFLSGNFHDEAEYHSNGENNENADDADCIMSMNASLCDATNSGDESDEELTPCDSESDDSFVIPPTEELSEDSDRRVNPKAKRKRDLKKLKEFRAYILDNNQDEVNDVWSSSGSDFGSDEEDSDEEYSEEFSDEEFLEEYSDDEDYSGEYYDSESSGESEYDESLRSRVVADLPIEGLPQVPIDDEIKCCCDHAQSLPEEESFSSSED